MKPTAFGLILLSVISVHTCPENDGIIGAKNIKNLTRIQNKNKNKALPPYTGTFILAEEVGEKRIITEICTFGVINCTTALSNSTDNIKGTLDILIIEHINNNLWKIRTMDKFYQDYEFKRKNICKNNIQKEMMKGDRVAVHIPSNCVYNKSMTYEYCPPQIKYSGNDVEVIDWAYSFDDLYEGKELQIEINKHIQSHVGFNFQMKYCIKKEENSTRIAIAVTTVMVLFIAIILLFLLIIIMWRMFSRKMKRATQGMQERVHMIHNTGDTQFDSVDYSLQNTKKSEAKRTQSVHIHCHGLCTTSATKSNSDTVAVDDYRSFLLNNEDQTVEEAHDVESTLISHDYDELYFEPASEEEELLQQLKQLPIPIIPEENLKLSFSNLLGSGAFGTVHRGVWSHSGSESDQVVEEEVAVKMIESGANEEERVKFLQEAIIMGQFNHPNIIATLGIVINKMFGIVTEVMNNGDLHKYLGALHPSPDQRVPPELAPTLLSYSRQVANGMSYLAMRCFVHRDLAARNILVSKDGVCKIADFGLSRDLQDAKYYVSHGGKIPVKWTAPEALHYHKYSTASDVWSYGCFLYEVWTLGYKPFHDLTNSEVIEKLSAGFRLAPPTGCPRAIYHVMIQCWNPDPGWRPSFADILISLQKPDFQILNWMAKETNMYSEKSRTLGAGLDAGHQLHIDLQKMYLKN